MSRVKFWMIVGSGTPTYRHPTKHLAWLEAERLAKASPGTEFVVLESVATVVKSDMHWELNDEDNNDDEPEVPFLIPGNS